MNKAEIRRDKKLRKKAERARKRADYLFKVGKTEKKTPRPRPKEEE